MTQTVIDVRSIVPRERHPLIFRTYGALEPGQPFEFVNDHDPKPLYYQFQAEKTPAGVGSLPALPSMKRR